MYYQLFLNIIVLNSDINDRLNKNNGSVFCIGNLFGDRNRSTYNKKKKRKQFYSFME